MDGSNSKADASLAERRDLLRAQDSTGGPTVVFLFTHVFNELLWILFVSLFCAFRGISFGLLGEG